MIKLNDVDLNIPFLNNLKKMKKYLVFDTETTGLPPYRKVENSKEIASPLKYLKHWDECRIVEIAWLLYDEEGTCLKKEEHIIQPKNYIIPDEASRIHGITQEIAIEKGIEIEFVLSMFASDLAEANYLVAHNMDFDYNVLLAEWLRYTPSTAEPFILIPKICTMKDFLKPNERWPRLADLYYKCTGKPFFQQHRALGDAMACASILFKLIEKTGI